MKQTGVPIRTVQRWIEKYTKTGSQHRAIASGRPKVLTKRDERQVLRNAKSEQCQTLSDITNSCPTPVSKSTVRRVLHANGIHSRIAKQKPFLKPRHIIARRKFTAAHKDCTLEDWRKVVWTDESSFELGKNCRVVRVWRAAHEADYQDCIAPTFKSDHSTVMIIWGAITYNHKSELMFIEKNRRTAVDFIDQVYAGALYNFWNSLEDPLLMEDGAPVHRARAPKLWREQNRIVKMDWPAQSPDLNPIEHVWQQMKLAVEAKMVNTSKDIETLKVAIQEAWDEFPIENVNKLVDSVPNRVNLVRKAGGRNTRY